ncbi:MAG: flavodoxin domain-containing protein [Anaerolineales bacterium]
MKPLTVLFAYATSYGSTREVAEAAAAELREGGMKVDVRPAREMSALEGYGAVVLGAPLIMFAWHRDARRFLSRNRKALKRIPVAVFALGPTHEPHDEEEWRDSRAQFDRALAAFGWFHPVARAVFGGKYDPAKLSFLIRMMAGGVPASDVRDWAAIRAWAAGLKTVLLKRNATMTSKMSQ